MWCVPELNDEFIARMENVLELYARPFKWNEPVVVLDERPVQLLDPERKGVAMRPGKPARTDYEYVRRGTANIFCVVQPLTGDRLTRATRNRKGAAYARMLARIAKRFAHARTIHLVQDNLSTHTEKSLIATYGAKAGGKLWRRFTVHYTPKHGSWLNPAEIEASLVARECLGTRRIGDLSTLRREVTAWRRRASHHRRSIDWKFRVHDARRVFRYEGIKTVRSGH
jgi:DDE superfamily endonuclease